MTGSNRAAMVLLVVSLALSTALTAPIARAEDPPDVRQRIAISGLTFVAGSNSQSELVLWAEAARVDTGRQVVDLDQLQISLAAGESRPSIDLRCRRGELNLLTYDIRLEGDVRGRTGDGRAFETEWLRYDEAAELLYTDATVVLRERGGTYRAGGLRLGLADRHLLLVDGVRVVRE